MRNQLITVVILLVITSLTRTINAQSVERFKIDVPFPFVLTGHTLPAGRYVLERSDPTRPNILTLKNASKGTVRLMLTQRVEKENPSAESSLVFIQRGGNRYLFQVWNIGAMNGSQILFALDTKASDHYDSNVTLVTLRAKNH